MKFASLITSIRSLSRELEGSLAKQDKWNSLSEFESLKKITELSLNPEKQIPSPEPAIPNPASQIPAPTKHSELTGKIIGHSPHPTRYATRKNEYAPALNQNDLVQALLRYQQQRGSRSKIKSAPNVTQNTTAVPDFSPMQFPSVSAEPKQTRLNLTPGVRIPILRSKPENRNGGQ